MIQQSNDKYIIDALLTLDDFNKKFNCDLIDEDVETIGGFLINKFEKYQKSKNLLKPEISCSQCSPQIQKKSIVFNLSSKKVINNLKLFIIFISSILYVLSFSPFDYKLLIFISMISMFYVLDNSLTRNRIKYIFAFFNLGSFNWSFMDKRVVDNLWIYKLCDKLCYYIFIDYYY